MRIGALLTLRAGGPGSGCHGPNCGRPSGTRAKIAKSEFPLTAWQKKAEARFRLQIGRDPEAAAAEYKRRFGNELNADKAKELSADYLANRTDGAAAVHEPASFLMRKMYADELAKAAPAGKQNMVFFTAGGAGAGKTSAVEGVAGQNAIKDKAQIVYDGTLRPAESAIAKIDQALAAGKSVHITYTHRDPESAFKNGVLGRAARQEESIGSGRTVMADEFARQHSSIQDSMQRVAERYANDPRVRLDVIDNSRGRDGQVASTLDKLPRNPSFEELQPKVHEWLNEERAAGRVSSRIYKATRGVSAKTEVGM